MSLNPSTGWSYYRKIDLTDSNNISENYQLNLWLAKDTDSESVSGGYIDCDNKCSDWPNDIRFGTTSDTETSTEIPQWYESSNSLQTSTQIWLKLPESDTIYMFVGNSTANHYSSGEQVWLFYDNFEEGILDTTKWNRVYTKGNTKLSTTLQYSGNQSMKISGNATNDDYEGVQNKNTNKITQYSGLRFKFKWAFDNPGKTISNGDYFTVLDANNTQGYILNQGSNTLYYYNGSYVAFSPQLTININKFYDIELDIIKGVTKPIKCVIDKGIYLTTGQQAFTSYLVSGTILSENTPAATKHANYTDLFCVGRYSESHEPSWTTFGDWTEIESTATEREGHPTASHIAFPYFFSGVDGVDGDGRGICFRDLVIEVVPYGAPIWINDLAIFYGAGLATDYIDTKCSRWDVQDYSVIVSTWLKKDDVDTLLDNIRPGAVKEIMKILGKPTFRDISWTGKNTIRLYPTPSSQKMNSSTLHRMRRNTIIYPQNITMHPINGSDFIDVKIEGKISGNSL